MSGSFFGLNVAVRGLYAAQRQLDIIGHNLTNANTPGFSKQYGVQTATPALRTYNGSGMIGTGTDVTATLRMRDEYLDTKYWIESLGYGEWSVKSTLMSELEAAFNEPSDSGFTQNMDEFFSALQELSKDSTSGATRALVKEKGVTLAKFFNNMATQLEKFQADMNDAVMIKVDEINTLAQQIANINDQIFRSEFGGNTANDLRDQRTVMIDKLSSLVNIDVNEELNGYTPSGQENRKLVITISGKPLVNGFSCTGLKCVPRNDKANPEDIGGLVDIRWEDDISIEIRGGELKGYLDMRDGNDIRSGSYKGLEYGSGPSGLVSSAVDHIVVDGHKIPVKWDDYTGTFNFNADYTGSPADAESLRKTIEDAINGAIDKYNGTTNTGSDVEHVTVEVDQLYNRLKVISGTTGKRSSVNFDLSASDPNSIANFYLDAPPSADIIRGNAIDFKGIPFYMKKLDQFVRTFAKAFNEGYVAIDRTGSAVGSSGLTGDLSGHADGYINNSTSTAGPDRIRFFTIMEKDISLSSGKFVDSTVDSIADQKDRIRAISGIYDQMTAKNFAVSLDILNDTNNIAVSSTGGQNGNTDNLLKLIEYRHNTSMFSDGEPEDFMKSLVGTLGIDAELAENFSKNQEVMVQQIENRRLSISSVSENEEMVNLVRFQHTYNASAKMISVMSEIYDKLINGLGV